MLCKSNEFFKPLSPSPGCKRTFKTNHPTGSHAVGVGVAHTQSLNSEQLHRIPSPGSLTQVRPSEATGCSDPNPVYALPSRQVSFTAVDHSVSREVSVGFPSPLFRKAGFHSGGHFYDLLLGLEPLPNTRGPPTSLSWSHQLRTQQAPWPPSWFPTSPSEVGWGFPGKASLAQLGDFLSRWPVLSSFKLSSPPVL